MYNIKGPSKIVAKTTRRGIAQNIDSFREYNRTKSAEYEQNDITTVPKPIFHKKTSSNNHRQQIISPQHEEIIKFINDSWNLVCSEGEQISEDSSVSPRSDESIIYYEEEPSDLLQTFQPFDLESWWGKRLYAHITNSVNVKN